MFKRLINLAGSLIVYASDLLGNLLTRISGQSPRKTCIVLAYHSVTRNQRSLFAKQLDMIVRLATPVRADLGLLPTASERFAAVTFDDGLENIIENALPELEKRNIPSTLFIVTDALGTNPSWEYFGGDDPKEERAMTEEQLRQLPSTLVTIGSHTMTHPLLPSVTAEIVRGELVGSREKLAKITNQEITLFSFPYGGFNESVVELCREANYRRVFTALPIFAFSSPNEFVTGRAGTSPLDWPIEFRLKLAGAYRWLPYAFSLKRNIKSMLRGQGSERVGLKTGEKGAA
jgi:peptidoglycan/xylan/chitin deacetylase (PgdA/CDA1 family)